MTSTSALPFNEPSNEPSNDSSPTALDFAHLVWLIGEETQKLALVLPGFRVSPSGRRRLLRSADAVPVVAVVNRGRSVAELLSDLVDGVVAVNVSVRQTDLSCDEARILLFDRVMSRYRTLETFVAA